MTEQERTVLEFLRRNSLAVIATVDDLSRKPESAVLRYSQTDKLEIIFETFFTYRKYKNLQANGNVAFVIGWDEHITVQYEGIAEELHGDESEEAKTIHIKKLPQLAKLQEKKEIRYFKVKPVWIRYSDLSVSPWKVFEINTFQ
jgi:uncharacterized pyridoxamine 5'-phosphate oxidase family protein